MELKDFEKLLEQYEEDELTSEIIYDLCVKFKSLPLSERGDYTWEVLNERFGHFKATGENLRCWVKSRQYEDGTIVENPRVLKDGRTPNDLELQEIEDKYNEKIEQLYKAKIKATKVINQRNKMWRSEVAKEELHNAIIEAAKEMKPIVIKEKKFTSGTTEAVVMISDWHIGNCFDLFMNSYNYEIAVKRVEKYLNKVVEQIKRNNVKKVNVINLGDSVNGFLRTTNRIENEFDIAQQVIKATELVAQFLAKIAENVPEITYRSVLDNHGRLTAQYVDSIREENVTVLMDWYLEQRFKNTKVQICHDNLDNSMMHFTLLNGKKCVGVHGDQGSGVNSIVQEVYGATREFTDVIFMGHMHQEKEKMFQGTRVIMCNSLMGPDQFARSKNLYGDPSQTTVIFEDDGSFSINVTTFENIK